MKRCWICKQPAHAEDGSTVCTPPKETDETPPNARWRTGTKLGRTLYVAYTKSKEDPDA